jgi:hypothetical protein
MPQMHSDFASATEKFSPSPGGRGTEGEVVSTPGGDGTDYLEPSRTSLCTGGTAAAKDCSRAR